MPASPSDLLSTSVVARELGVTSQCVRNWLRSGQLRGYVIGHQYKVDPADLAEFVRPARAS